ncbi:GAF domain-containing protein [Desulfocicer vacuolatum DSM 3385]|uniref:GAF domain-containing protein n=1 Tax=Desulfocicer vacuolatum DSM 3385 TaxID=1121400 RepID=A0A1W2DFL3_9BACT|nr:HD domain-containing phosphohydrolase [Desulfocicer vacuolatum]SMC96329.1 GAF domain-containing protein [Desulfocicer vacuolatum DSM 3385]
MMLTEQERIDLMTELSIELGQVQDLDILMEHILTKARMVANADAGSIYIREKNCLRITFTQNDTLQGRLKSGEKLIYSSFYIKINKESIAGYVAVTGELMNIKDVYHIDPSKSYHFNEHVDHKADYQTKSMLTIPLKQFNGEVLGILQIINARDAQGHDTVFSREDEKIMCHFAATASMALERAKITRTILLRMVHMAELRDPRETGAHVNRVAAYATEIYEGWALRRKLDRKKIDQIRDRLRIAAMLHDVGKVGISDLILKKPGKLTPEEYEIMKAHTSIGKRLFINKASDYDDDAMEVALSHHERWDGTGYPGYVDDTHAPIPGKVDANGKPLIKKGKDIPLFGRIVAVADVYDALCSRRVYKEAWDDGRVNTVMRKNAGSHFDPELVDIFFERMNIIHFIRDRYRDV